MISFTMITPVFASDNQTVVPPVDIGAIRGVNKTFTRTIGSNTITYLVTGTVSYFADGTLQDYDLDVDVTNHSATSGPLETYLSIEGNHIYLNTTCWGFNMKFPKYKFLVV